MMGIDWRDQTWWQYQAALGAYEHINSDDPGGTEDLSRLKRAMAAHQVH